MTREQRKKISTVIRYVLLVAVGFIMVYPLIWMVGATFKTNSEIFTSAWFWPKNPVSMGILCSRHMMEAVRSTTASFLSITS